MMVRIYLHARLKKPYLHEINIDVTGIYSDTTSVTINLQQISSDLLPFLNDVYPLLQFPPRPRPIAQTSPTDFLMPQFHKGLNVLP